jgi:hypothetical protein
MRTIGGLNDLIHFLLFYLQSYCINIMISATSCIRFNLIIIFAGIKISTHSGIMRKLRKNIPVLFLWLASLAMVAHMVIPHDHHLAESTTSDDESCPASENKNGHKTGFPVHCHAFNDLNADKARPIQISQNVHENTLLFYIISNTSIADLPVSGEGLTDLDKPLFNYITLDLSLLRAPPVFS